MQILNNTFFWIILFVLQVYFLSLLSSKIFNLLYSYLHKVFKKDSTVVFVISMLFLPGTFIHELSHAITATLLGSRVTKFSIWPTVEGGTIKMGYAQFVVKDIFRNTLIGISPLVFGILILYFLILNFFTADFYLKIVILYFIFQVSNSMFLSESDVRDLKILTLVALVLAVLVFLVDNFYLKLNLLQGISLGNFFKDYFNFFFYLNIFFVITIFINLGLLVVVKILNKFHRY